MKIGIIGLMGSRTGFSAITPGKSRAVRQTMTAMVFGFQQLPLVLERGD